MRGMVHEHLCNGCSGYLKPGAGSLRMTILGELPSVLHVRALSNITEGRAEGTHLPISREEHFWGEPRSSST